RIDVDRGGRVGGGRGLPCRYGVDRAAVQAPGVTAARRLEPAREQREVARRVGGAEQARRDALEEEGERRRRPEPERLGLARDLRDLGRQPERVTVDRELLVQAARRASEDAAPGAALGVGG